MVAANAGQLRTCCHGLLEWLACVKWTERWKTPAVSTALFLLCFWADVLPHQLVLGRTMIDLALLLMPTADTGCRLTRASDAAGGAACLSWTGTCSIHQQQRYHDSVSTAGAVQRRFSAVCCGARLCGWCRGVSGPILDASVCPACLQRVHGQTMAIHVAPRSSLLVGVWGTLVLR